MQNIPCYNSLKPVVQSLRMSYIFEQKIRRQNTKLKETCNVHEKMGYGNNLTGCTISLFLLI